MRWIRFFRVKNHERVMLGTRRAVKLSFCSASVFIAGMADSGDYIWVNPFRRVRTGKPVKSDYPIRGTTTGRALNPGQTYFVGDCLGGHHELPKAAGSMNIPHGGEPHNCNNVTGQTS